MRRANRAGPVSNKSRKMQQSSIVRCPCATFDASCCPVTNVSGSICWFRRGCACLHLLGGLLSIVPRLIVLTVARCCWLLLFCRCRLSRVVVRSKFRRITRCAVIWKILYLRPRLKIVLRGEPIRSPHPLTDLAFERKQYDIRHAMPH